MASSSSFFSEGDGFERYAAAARSSEYLPLDVERILVARAAAGDCAAKQTLVRSHIRMVLSVARNYLWSGHPLEELVSVGCVGLVMAADKVDPSKDNLFATYARWWIDSELKTFTFKNMSSLKVPMNHATKTLFARAARKTAEVEALGFAGHERDRMVAAALGVDADELFQFRAALNGVISADAPVGLEDDGGTVVDAIPDGAPSPEDALIASDEHDDNVRRLREALAQLTEREADVLRSRRMVEEPLTLEQLASRHAVSRERIRQIEVKAMEKMRGFLMAA